MKSGIKGVHFFALAVLLLAATDMPAATIMVTNGNDSGPGSLRQAILNALSGDTINFVSSVTAINLTSGELIIEKNLTITGPGADRLTVQRSTNGLDFRIFHISSNTATVSISGITISNGSAIYGSGGGILSLGALTLTDCTISGNQAFGDIGRGGGGGVLNEAAMIISHCSITNNSAIGFSTPDTQLPPAGGGILNDLGGSLIITNSTVSSNSSVFDSINIFQSLASGGGIQNDGSMTITNCTISGNSVSGSGLVTMHGGGIWNAGSLQITSSTVVDNSATGGNDAAGGGIYGIQPTTIDSSIIALNTAPVGPDFTGAGELQSTGYNIVGNNADAVIISQPTDQIGTPAAPIDPLLGPLADNGGPTLTHTLEFGSPAINRGDPAAPPRDQRAYSRLGVPDVGAFELGGSPPRADFNGDGFTDYLLSNFAGRGTAVWYLHDNTYLSGSYGPTLPAGWTAIDVADFNHDGHPDYALFNAGTRQTAIWYLNNSVYVSGVYGPTLPSGWQLVAIGDFNRDNKPDYVLYNTSTRQTAIWYLNNNVYVSGAYGPTIANGYVLSGIADFNGDGKPDYVLFAVSTRQTAIWYLNNNVYVSGAYGPTIASGYVQSGVADFNIDGHPDYLLYNSTTRRTAIWYLNNNVYVGAAYGPTLPVGWSLVAP